MKEGDGGWEGSVVVYYVGEVGHAFAALVERGGEDGIRVGVYVYVGGDGGAEMRRGDGVEGALPAKGAVSRASHTYISVKHSGGFCVLRQILSYPARIVLLKLRHDDHLVDDDDFTGYRRRLLLQRAMLERALDVGRDVILIPNLVKFSDEKGAWN